ncbi:M56 family metallopeptidase [Carboxylicivirga caseinilyticus]|uniref:M56 family metallopeptidase n=1 Tax=Carboxylicivirga caseinilyticus TaxID=3417572 RepID=UPI003D334A11|nr:M56 family metallopeptidase [Marinilabiliaceae bacterium A049]
MAKFLIYLFESGLCLSLFYLGYIVFFRKETYFTFNRFYLLGSMILALTVPLISFPFDLTNQGYLHETANGVRQFRNYYEHLIQLTDPGALADPMAKTTGGQTTNSSQIISKESIISISGILISIYILGVLFFSFRLFYLIGGIRKMLRRAKIQKDNGMNLVLINDEVPSFSFLKWIFVNPQILKPEEFEQVLTHEKVHVQHKHSVDLLLAHIMTIFQWFNPLTWRIQKSIKTCHEYIADRQVVLQGHGLFDYQSLLLSQLISIRSVELVNNFNLLSIKKRIAMMNKHKSGRWAQLKAIAVVPILLAAFFFFTDMTSRSETLNLQDNIVTDTNELVGSWVSNETGINQIQFVEIKPEKLLAVTTVGNNSLNITDYKLETKKKKLILKDGDDILKLDYIINNNKLTIDWGLKGKVDYLRKIETDSYTLMDEGFQKLNLPYATQLNPYKKEMILCTIFLSGDILTIDGNKCSFSELESILTKLRSSADQSKVDKMSVLLNIDKDASMKYVDQIKTALRNSNNLKLGYLAKMEGKEGSDYMALFNLLPPLDAKWLEKEDIAKEGISLFEIGKKHNDFSKRLKEFTKSNTKYVMLYEYDNKTSYEDYIKTIDLVYKTINDNRKEAAFFDGKHYENLDYEEQKEYRKKYPITLTMKNLDEN